MWAETEGNEKCELESSFCSYYLSVCGKGVTEQGVIEYASRNGRGREGWWKNCGIRNKLIHHGECC